MNLSLAPPPPPSTSCRSYTYMPAVFGRIRKPIGRICVEGTLRCKEIKRRKDLRFLKVGSSSERAFISSCTGRDMTIREEEQEENAPLLEPEFNSRPRRIALFVEPSPFAWVFLFCLFVIASCSRFEAFGLPILLVDFATLVASVGWSGSIMSNYAIYCLPHLLYFLFCIQSRKCAMKMTTPSCLSIVNAPGAIIFMFLDLIV